MEPTTRSSARSGKAARAPVGLPSGSSTGRGCRSGAPVRAAAVCAVSASRASSDTTGSSDPRARGSRWRRITPRSTSVTPMSTVRAPTTRAAPEVAVRATSATVSTPARRSARSASADARSETRSVSAARDRLCSHSSRTVSSVAVVRSSSSGGRHQRIPIVATTPRPGASSGSTAATRAPASRSRSAIPPGRARRHSCGSRRSTVRPASTSRTRVGIPSRGSSVRSATAGSVPLRWWRRTTSPSTSPNDVMSAPSSAGTWSPITSATSSTVAARASRWARAAVRLIVALVSRRSWS
jgi:hypothetical protein